MRATKTAEERFWAKVSRGTPDQCWLWTGVLGGNGYGLLHMGSKTVRHPARAHRFSWELHNGPIPEGLWVLHKCDVKVCVNPAHLFLGDRTANMRDCAAKGRLCTIGRGLLTHCARGHEFTPENTFIYPNGHRRCRSCSKIFRQARTARARDLRRAAMTLACAAAIRTPDEAQG